MSPAGKYLATMIAPILREGGYKKKGATWRRETNDAVAVVNLQMSPYAGILYYLNLGIYVKALGSIAQPLEYQCPFRIRVEALMNDRQRALAVFDLSNQSITQAERDKELKLAVLTLALPFLQSCATVKGLNDVLIKNPKLRHCADKNLLDHLGIPNTRDW